MGFSLIESLVMLALLFVVGVLTVSLLRKDLIGLDTSQPVDTVLHSIFKFSDEDESGVTIKGLPPLIEGDQREEVNAPEPSNEEDPAAFPPEAPPF
jgi:hypothetical protein